MYRKNVAGQFVCFQMLLTASGAVATGLAPTVRRCIDGTFAAGGGTVTEDGSTGAYKYAMAQADTNGNDISFIFSAATAMPVCVNIITTAADPTDGVRLGLTALPSAAAGANGGLPTGNASGQVAVSSIAAGAISAATFAANALDAVWSTASRLLTAGTNIVLAKGTGVTGFNDLDAAGVRVAVGLASANLDTQLSGINAKTTNLPSDPADQSLIIAAIGGISAPDNAGIAAIKAKTDSLTFTKPGQVDSNIQSVNDTAVTGTGHAGSEWGPA